MATTSIGAPGVTFPDSSVQTVAFDIASTGTKLTVYEGPSPQSVAWTKPATLKGVHVRVYASGGNGGSTSPVPNSSVFGGGGGGGGSSVGWFPGPSIPGPQTITLGAPGSPSSFGTLISATAGATPGNNSNVGGAGGVGSGGQFFFTGVAGTTGSGPTQGGGGYGSFMCVDTIFTVLTPAPNQRAAGSPNPNISGGGTGASNKNAGGGPAAGGSGGKSIIILEEFY